MHAFLNHQDIPNSNISTLIILKGLFLQLIHTRRPNVRAAVIVNSKGYIDVQRFEGNFTRGRLP